MSAGVAARPVVARLAPVAGGALLGLLAYAGDDAGLGDHLNLGFHQERALVAVTGSGLVWGLAAFLGGYAVPDRRRAAAAATVLLVSATTVYYLLIALVSRRWSGGTLQDGGSADLSGLLDVVVMTVVWLAGSLIVGPVFGVLGHTVRTRVPRRAAGAAAVTCGLLASEAVYRLVSYLPDGGAVPPAEIIGVTVPLLVLTVLTVRDRLWAGRRVLPFAFAVAAGAGALFWWAAETLRHAL